MQNNILLLNKIKLIRLLILDVDGVLTDGKIFINDDGAEFKAFYGQDGVAMKALLKHGIDIAIISGRPSPATEHRMRGLGVNHVYLNQKDKNLAFMDLKQKLNLTNDQIAYVGDDVPDLVVMQQVGLSIAVTNAIPEVKKQADWITNFEGGKGAVREVCDLLTNSHVIPAKAGI